VRRRPRFLGLNEIRQEICAELAAECATLPAYDDEQREVVRCINAADARLAYRVYAPGGHEEKRTLLAAPHIWRGVAR
jgi:hypothetical protein